MRKSQQPISDPLQESIDIHIEVPCVDYEKLSGDRVEETSASIHARALTARNIQLQRFSKNGSSSTVCHVDIRIQEIRMFYKLQDEGVVLTVRLSLAVSEASEPDASGNEPAQCIGTRLSRHLETGTHDCGFGGR